MSLQFKAKGGFVKQMLLLFVMILSTVSHAFPGMPKTVVFVKNALGETFTLRLKNLDQKEAYLSSCMVGGTAWWNFPKSSKVLLDGREMYLSEGRVKVHYKNQNSNCSSLSQFERMLIPLRNIAVYSYSVNLHVIYSSTYIGAVLETPDGDFYGKVTGVWGE